jgi:hypothetical protein
VDFSQALEQLKVGRKVTRDGWNGKDQWVVRQNGYPEGIPLNRNTAQATGIAEGTVMVFEPYFMLYTPWSTFVPWTPSTGDLNADDWSVYYAEADSARETAEILADPQAMADLAQAMADLAEAADDGMPYSPEELGVALQVSRFEKADISDKEAARFRLMRTLLLPVIARQRAEDGTPLLFPPTDTVGVAEAIHGFVGVIIRLQGDLEAATKDIRRYRDQHDQVRAAVDEALTLGGVTGLSLESDIALLGRQRDEARANLEATVLGNLMDGVDEFERLGVALVPTIADWRKRLGPDVNTDGWAVTVSGHNEPGLGNRVTSVQIDSRDPGYPTRPQRLADAMRLRQSFPTETPDSPEPDPWQP